MQSQLDFEQDVKNLGVRVRVIPNVLLRQRLRIVRLVLRKVLPKDFRQMIHKKLEILRILEIFAQETFQAPRGHAPEAGSFSTGAHRKISHSNDATSAVNISSITSPGFTAASIRARSSS